MGSVYHANLPPESDRYPAGPDSQPHPSVPAGKTFEFRLADSKIFPGTVRTIQVYIPAQYRSDKPACVYVGLDGLMFDAAVAFDNLIARGRMPVTIGVGIEPGVTPSAGGDEDPRFDRSQEFDTRSARLATFILKEVLPAVEAHRTPGGDRIVLSTRADDRAIGGASTGGIGSFTVAWERPDAFHRVFLSIGTFVGMRGGERTYVEVRKTEPKPLRIFQQDGVYDEWPGGPEMGDWWMSNLTMNRALEFAGYDVRHVWGSGTHNTAHATALFPEAMAWLWRGWPATIQPGKSGNPGLKILQPGQDWQMVARDCAPGENQTVGERGYQLASDARGRIFYATNGPASATEVDEHAGPVHCLGTGDGGRAIAFGPSGALYQATDTGGIRVVARPNLSGAANSGAARLIAPALHVRSFTVRNNGDVYAIAKTSGGDDEVWLLRANGTTTRLDTNIEDGAGIAFSPDGLWLFVAQARSHLGLSYRVRADGSLDARAPFYDFDVPAWADDSGAGSVAMDREARAYAATRMGVQVFDRNGRVIAILPLPRGERAMSLCFGGRSFDTLYVSTGGRVYRRKLNTTGVPPWQPPVKLSPGSPG